MIEVVNLNKSFGDVSVLHDININIEKGEKVVVIGPSGSGKSTFLRCLNCMEDPTSGSIIFNGVDIADMKVDINIHRQKMGMVFQHFNLFPHMTVKENIMLAPVELKKMTSAEAEQTAYQLLERVGLKDKADSYPAQLSGGQKQRLCIARALLKKPKILILDDSTSAVDTKTDAIIRAGFKKFIPETTKIIIAQRVSSVQDADQIIIMNNGSVEAIGTHDELLASNPIYQEVYYSQNKGGEQDEK